MFEIIRLSHSIYAGRKFEAEIVSDQYLSIEPSESGFALKMAKADKEIRRNLQDTMLAERVGGKSIAYGAVEGAELVGFVEGFLEKRNNRFRITNICVFQEEKRRKGAGTKLIRRIMNDAKVSGARMVVLETQSYNAKAINFYKKNGFEIIGFDRYAYANEGPEEHNMRVEMGKKL